LEVYDLSDNNWTQKFPSSNPDYRFLHQMAYIGSDKALLFGGHDLTSLSNETWIYDLSQNSWVLDLNTTQPLGRDYFGLSETSLDGSSYLVLFGGYSGGNLGDTWTFGGGDYALPVSLSSFTAISGDGKVTLKWTTQSEEDNVGFIIERSIGNVNSFGELASYINYNELQGKINSSTVTNYTFTDNTVINGMTYYYRLSDVDLNGNRFFHQIVNATPNTQGIHVEKKEPILSKFYLYQNYPNPFNPETTIKFEVPLTQVGLEQIELTIYSSIGKKVKDIFSGSLAPGVYEIKWNGQNDDEIKQPSGVYFIHYQTNHMSKNRKILLVR
jgi:hypothetical protein